MNDLVIFFDRIAKNSFAENKTTKSRIAKRKDKPWFSISCREKRKIFHKAKNKYNKFKSIHNKAHLVKASKKYKIEMANSFKRYQVQIEKKIRQTSKHNPKEFWKLLDEISPKKNIQSNIELETLYEHFKLLNKNDAEEQEFQMPEFDVNKFGDILNGAISEEDEISKV